MTTATRNAISGIIERLGAIRGEIDELKGEEIQAYCRMPYAVQLSKEGREQEIDALALEDAGCEVGSAIFRLNSFIS